MVTSILQDPNLCKASKDAYNQGEWLILKDLLSEWVAEGVASDPHDFSHGSLCGRGSAKQCVEPIRFNKVVMRCVPSGGR